MTGENSNTEQGNDKQEQAPLTAKEATELRDALVGLNTGLKELQKAAAERQAAEASAAGNTNSSDEGGDSDEPDVDDEKLEEMPRRQFMDFMLRQVAKHMDTNLKEVKTAIQQVGTQTQRTALEAEANAFAAKHEDFADFEQEMIAIARQNPGLSVARIYALAKVENPDKVKQVEEKYKKGKEKEKGKEEGGNTPPPPRRNRASNGMSPSGTGGSEPNRRMSAEDAAAKAWDEAVAVFGNPFGPQ